MVFSSLHKVDDMPHQVFNKVVMEPEMVQKLSFRQERRIASFAPTDSAIKVTHIIRGPSMLTEHVLYNLLGILETLEATSGLLLAILHGTKVIELVLSVFHML
jgi:hypothetical protein